MKYRLSAALLLATVMPAAAIRGQDGREFPESLEGTWVLTAMEKNGNAAPKYVLGKLNFTFKEDTMIMGGQLTAAPGKEPVKQKFTFKLDRVKEPDAIDLIPLEGDFKGKTVPGIYRLEGEELKLCLPKQGDKERPSAFKSPEGSDLAFMTFKRSKE